MAELDKDNILFRLASYTKAILEDNKEDGYKVKVRYGRTNFDRKDFNENLVTVDYSTATPIGRGETFDGTKEVTSHTVLTKYHATITSYGEDARVNLDKLNAYSNSQLARDKQREFGLTVHNFSSITNLREIQGLLKKAGGVDEVYEAQLTLYSYDTTDIKTKKTTLALGKNKFGFC